MSQRVFRETQEEKEGKRGAIGGGGGGRERERDIQKHTHRDREREEGRGRDTEVGYLSVCAVWVLHLLCLPVLPCSLSPAVTATPAVFSCEDKHWRTCNQRGEICKGSVGLSWDPCLCLLREYL